MLISVLNKNCVICASKPGKISLQECASNADPDQNPYAPPAGVGDLTPSDWYLVSACRYFKWIGWMAIIYILCVIPIGVRSSLADNSTRVRELIGMTVMATGFLLFFAIMVRTAVLLPKDFDRYYRRARWLGILAGAIGCPLLTIPAYVAISRLAKYRKMKSDSS